MALDSKTLDALLARMRSASTGCAEPDTTDEKPAREVSAVALGAEKTVRGAKAPRKSAEAPQAADAPKSPIVVAEPLPPLTAEGFMRAIKLAGWRQRKHPKTGEPVVNEHGAPVLGPTTDDAKRADERAALVRFGGFDKQTPHGTQVSNAMRRAKLALDSSLGGDGKVKRSAPTVAGVVAGACNQAEKVRLHLEADLRAAIATVANLSRDDASLPVPGQFDAAGFAKCIALSDDEREALLAHAEKDLAEVRAALARLG